MTQEANGPAFDTVEEARQALDAGIRVLHDAAARESNGSLGEKQLDFSKGCLMDLRLSLTMTVPADPRVPTLGVNPGCSR